jgi:hypothetical protein
MEETGISAEPAWPMLDIYKFGRKGKALGWTSIAKTFTPLKV